MAEIFALSLGLTLVFELGYAWLWGVTGKDFFLVIIMNILTNPLVVAWHYSTQNMGLLISTVLPELCAIATECVLLSVFGKNIQKPVKLGIFINIFSYFTGVLINLLIF